MTAAVAGAVRGRPSVTALQESLGRARETNVNLSLELAAERGEHRAFAERVRQGATRLIACATDQMAVANEAGKLGYLADRRIAQIGSVVL